MQLVLTLGMALFLSALTVHFRDIQSILQHVLHLWFFATPVIYSYAQIAEGTPLRRVLRLNPMTHVIVTYQQMLFHGNVDHWRGLFLALLVGLVAFAAGAFLFDRLRDTLRGGSVTTPAIVAQAVSKRYRRFAHRNQLRTLKSALLTGSVLADLAPEETFTALEDVSFEVARGLDLRGDRRERLGQVDAAEAGRRHHPADAAAAWSSTAASRR